MLGYILIAILSGSVGALMSSIFTINSYERGYQDAKEEIQKDSNRG